MKPMLSAFLACVLLLLSPLAAHGQPTNPAMNAPEQVAWQLFIQVNTAVSDNTPAFETWASDTDLFQLKPQFPSAPSTLKLHPPIVPHLGRLGRLRAGKYGLGLPPGVATGQMEEARRNKSTFDFIVENKLYLVSGLKAAFGKNFSFPGDSIEVKTDWAPVDQVPANIPAAGVPPKFVPVAQVLKDYHISKNSAGKQYALLSMHVISKLVPNWTWATFEHQLNLGRCDVIGCIDNFGAQTRVVKPASPTESGTIYPPCPKTSDLNALFSQTKLDPAFVNYCLKGTQSDFTDATGLAIRLGNSVTENGFVSQASCMTCHGRAAWGANGKATSVAGMDAGNAPLGPINPAWYWSYAGKLPQPSPPPPWVVGMSGLVQLGTASDFLWSIPFCAVDDTVNPPKLATDCQGK